ncbi:TonB-dependent receptor [Dokdonia pacifica]|uniref:Outer membrane receptor proteins, mostly Fe transport n=1 Tax=Dokdonia pacifica TaxID=1627892 RepID=A0A239E3M0_9FLAO|nr:outer membrane beta-barrel family protein [Dokdonia pacifica]GGG24253.1 TonB-dependent receptor [Dokdonia pacifica]SNS39079.1 Outer membrane receptor proteins, mostly Fe transport [Dokdonia pacifica]
MKINKVLAFVVMLLVPYWGISQVELKGQVKSKEEPIPFANVVLTNPDGTVKGGVITDESGAFAITTSKGTYTVTVSYLGYKNWTKEIVLEADTTMETIQIEPESENLEEVVVTAKKRIIEQKNDRLVFNVENSIAGSTGDAIDALKVAPGLIVQNSSISILGKGASQVMVDGRLLNLSGDDLVGFLNSISASDIKKIEIITNPPARYEAGGNGGLINIIFKKGVRNSWKNTTSLTYEQNEYGSIALRNNFSYNKNKYRLSASLNGTTGDYRSIENFSAFSPEVTQVLESDTRQKKDNVSGRVLFDYDLTEKTVIGFQYLGNYRQPDQDNESSTTIFDASNSLEAVLLNTGVNEREARSNIYNVHMTSELDTIGRSISVDVNYLDYNIDQDNSFTTETFLPGSQSPDNLFSALNNSELDIQNFSAKVDVEHPVEFFDLSYGGKLSFIESNSNINFFDATTGTPVLDPNQSNVFEYDESIQALYVNGSKSLSDKLSVQVGLRLENTTTTGFSRTLNQTNENDYLRLFPTFYLAYAKSDNHNFTFNYGKRVNRPRFNDLNPFRFFINSNSFSEGNPFLQPSFTDSFNFTYAYKRSLRTSAFFRITNDNFGIVFNSDTENNAQVITRQNYSKEYYYGIGESYSFNKISWWQSMSSVYLLGSKTELLETINAEVQNGVRLYFTTNNAFSLSKTTKFEANFWYSSSHKRGLNDTGETFSLNLGFKQSFLNKDLQLAVLVNDVFNQGFLNNNRSIINGVEQVGDFNYSSRFARVSLSYSFGNKKIRVRGRGFGNEEEKGRTGN